MKAMRAHANGIELEYETFGNRSDPAVLLVMGFTRQLISWDDEFCQALAARGFFVVAYDNRDAGLSSQVASKVRPNVMAILGGDLSTMAYGVEDMADDAAALIEALGLGSANVVGVSMGGMIVQSLAIRHPERVKSLVSIMSTTGDHSVGHAAPEVLALIMERPPREREAAIEHSARTWRALRSPAFAYDDAEERVKVARHYDRAFRPEGSARQAAAIAGAKDRTAALAEVKVPATVIHGESDPLIGVSGGEATARAIPGARLLRVPGMGHDLPPGLWSLVIDAIVETSSRGSGGSGGSGGR
jgi:pimeloyl-ACP methyl ester carboxylesterase